MGSRFLNPTVPGFLLTTVSGLLTANQQLVVQAIALGTYFVFNETPSGTMNGSNQTFTLVSAIKPTASLELYWNGQFLAQGSDYTLSGQTITLLGANKPNAGDAFKANYTVSPV